VASLQRRCRLATIQDVPWHGVRAQIELMAAWNCENRGWVDFVHFQLKDVAAKFAIRALMPHTSLSAGATQTLQLDHAWAPVAFLEGSFIFFMSEILLKVFNKGPSSFFEVVAGWQSPALTSRFYRGTSPTRKRTPSGPYRRPMPRVL